MNSAPRRRPGHWLSRIRLYSGLDFNRHAQEAHRVIAKERAHATMYFLDAGCGYGELSRQLASDLGDPSRVHGCDIDSNRLAYCRTLNPAIHYFHQDLLQPLKNDQHYDLIFLTTALAQFDEQQQQQVLAHLRNRLTPGGYVWIVDVQTARTKRLFRELKQSPLWQPVYDRPMAKRLWYRLPALMLAETWPHGLLRLMEQCLPGDWMLRQLVIKASEAEK